MTRKFYAKSVSLRIYDVNEDDFGDGKFYCKGAHSLCGT